MEPCFHCNDLTRGPQCGPCLRSGAWEEQGRSEASALVSHVLPSLVSSSRHPRPPSCGSRGLGGRVWAAPGSCCDVHLYLGLAARRLPGCGSLWGCVWGTPGLPASLRLLDPGHRDVRISRMTSRNKTAKPPGASKGQPQRAFCLGCIPDRSLFLPASPMCCWGRQLSVGDPVLCSK